MQKGLVELWHLQCHASILEWSRELEFAIIKQILLQLRCKQSRIVNSSHQANLLCSQRLIYKFDRLRGDSKKHRSLGSEKSLSLESKLVLI